MAATKGLESFLEVLELIKNPAKFDAKIAELKAATAQYTASVEAVVALSNVNDYTMSIRKREEESKKVLEDAKNEASTLVAKAKSEATELKAKAHKDAQKAVEAVASAQNKVDSATAREQQVRESEATLAKAWAELREKEKSLSDLSAELTERKNKLLAAMG